MTATGTEIEVVDLTEIVGDFEVCCEAQYHDGRPPCEHPAEWIMWRKGCCTAVGPYLLACDPHKEERVNNAVSLECSSCGYVWIDASDCYFMIERL